MKNKEILKKLESDYADIVEDVFPESGNGWWIHISVDKIKFLFDVKDTFMGRMKRIKFDMYDNFKEINYMIGQKYKFKIQK